MSENPYAATQVPIETKALPVVPEEILKKIKGAWIAGIVSGCITLVVTLVAMSGTSILGFSAWELIDVAVIFGLAYGIYRKSRTCAVIMLVYFVISKLLMMRQTGAANGIVLALIFLYYYYQGVVGTYCYHKLARTQVA